MKIKDFFIKTTIVVAIILLLFIILQAINLNTVKCNNDNLKISRFGKCYYITSNSCQLGEQISILNNNNVCLYDGKGFMTTKVFKVFLIIFGCIWLLVLIIYIINLIAKGNNKKEEFVSADRVKDIFGLWFSRNYNIPLVNNKEYMKSAFKFSKKFEPSVKEGEKFLKFEVRVVVGDNNFGTYTVIASQSKGEKYLLEGNFNIKDCLYDEYSRKRGWPLNESENPMDKYLNELAIDNPEKATELKQNLIEKRITTQPMEEPLQQQEQIQNAPAYRRFQSRRRYR